MNEMIQLSNAAFYSDKRVATDKLGIENYVSVDNMLQNRMGITESLKLPPGNKDLPAFEPGHILVGNIRPYLKKIWYADKFGCCSPDVLIFEVKEGYDTKFIYYCLFRDEFFEHVMRGAKGSKMPRGDKQQILDYLIPNIDLPKQNKIATLLSLLDSKIELNNTINVELENLIKLNFEYWFIQYDFPNEYGQPYNSSGGKMLYRKEIAQEIPVGWDVKFIGQLDNTFSGEGLKISSKDILEKGKYPVITQDSGPLIKGYTNENNPINDTPVIVFGDHSCTLRYIDFPFFRGADGTQVLSYDNHMTYYVFLFLKNVITQIPNYGKYERHFKYIKELKIVIPSEGPLNEFQLLIQPSLDRIRVNMQENEELMVLRDFLLPLLMSSQIKAS